MAAFVARRNFILRRKSDEERQAEAEVAKTWTSSISAFFSDFVEFTKDPIPFVLETAAANSDTVEYRAGLEARLYLHVLWSLMKLFTLLAIVALAIVLPINFLTSRATWAAKDSFSRTTANGFADPSAQLIVHTIISVCCTVFILYIVWNVRAYVAKHARNFMDSPELVIPPAQAFTVEIQGLRVSPPVTEQQLRSAVLDRFQAQHSDAQVLGVSLPLDVTDVVDVVERQEELKAQLARYKQQAANDGVRPLVIQGWLSWAWIGERVDAIEHLEREIATVGAELTRLQDPEVERQRAGSGTAFVTFTRADATATFLEEYRGYKHAATKGRFGDDVESVVRNENYWVVGMAHKPEDIIWRNLRYNRSQIVFMVVAVCLVLFIVFTTICTPIFFFQLVVFLGDATIEGTPDAVSDAGAMSRYESYIRSAGGPGAVAGAEDHNYWAHRLLRTVARLSTPLFLLLVNFFLMPYLVHFAVRACGFREISSRNRAAFCIICAFMLFNVLVIPALSLSGMDEFFQLTRAMSFDQVLAIMLLFGSSSSFFIDYIMQMALLGSAFYFIFHTTTPLIVHWASDGKEEELVWELDFAYFFSSAIAAAGIGLFFILVLPLSTPFVAGLFAMRYYTDKWQLLTAHSNEHANPSPESTVSAAMVLLLIVTAFAQASFAAWLNMQAADALALFPWISAGIIMIIVCVPQLNRQIASISARWENEDEEVKATSTVAAPQAYATAYVNPYMHTSAGYTALE
eukprot:CAMPEP_0113726952 /NCGR_PEP_ID=MMETSP0038_2-20120614/40773_1 /TAXON_ID=2898 /ORGANISM="Cryptomonas paramecium" /LENGTH=743 /DNA_ID=CAMNT_0000657727 /DNA_START=137 /DNA_END=2368 /DNA_ORIENTATION=- /assembly_acc=CAM_ASM_000170